MSREKVEQEIVRMRLRLAEIAEGLVVSGMSARDAVRVRSILRVTKGLLNEVEDRTQAVMDDGGLGKKVGRACIKEALLFGWCVVETAEFEAAERPRMDAVLGESVGS